MESTAIYREFIRCMAAFLRGESVAPTLSEDEWQALYALSLRQSLSGALFTAVDKTVVPDAVYRRLQQDAVKTLSQSEEQRLACRDLAEILTRAQVDHLFFKGAVVREFYREPMLRSMGDIDLAVRGADREAAYEALVAAGFIRTAHSEEVWSYHRYQTHVEVHTIVKGFDADKQDTVEYPDVFADATAVSGRTYRWQNDAEAAHCAAHLTAHFCGGGCGLRQLMDMAVLCEAFPEESFWRAVTARLETSGIDRFARHLLWFCRQWFGTAVPEAVMLPTDAATEEAMMRHMLSEGTFGTDARIAFAAYRRDRKKKRSRAARLFRRFFPPVMYLRRRFEYVEKHPWLAPVGYLHRAFNGVFKHRRIHQARRQYQKDNEHELEAELAFFDAVGL